MTFQTYLKINGAALPVQKDDYSVDYSDVVADSGGVTEAGTTIRDVIREGVPSISVTIPVSLTWLKKLRKIRMADNAGKITSAEIKSDPTRFMARTMITAMTMAISRLYLSA